MKEKIKGLTFLFILLIITTQLAAQVSGSIISKETNIPISGAMISVIGKSGVVYSDSKGQFSINARVGDSLIIYHMQYENYMIRISSLFDSIIVSMDFRNKNLKEIIIGSSGYKSFSLDNSIGSIDFISEDLLARNPLPNILNRIENTTPGLLFNKGAAANTDNFLIRGRSTITADAVPLIVLDDFPYEGDFSSIDPDNIESVTILKDASASSIWGARAANGVIILTTKKPKTSRIQVNFGSSYTFSSVPNIYNIQRISSKDRVEWEKYLFEIGRYSAASNTNVLSNRVNPIPLVAELLIKKPNGYEDIIEELKNNDVRQQIEKYLYRPSQTVKQNFGFQGGNDIARYSFSSGYWKTFSYLVGKDSEQLVLRQNLDLNIIKSLNISTMVQIGNTESKQTANKGISSNFGTNGLSPYANLIDDSGKALPYYGFYREDFINDMTVKGLQDWNFRPLEDLFKFKNKSVSQDVLLNASLKYRFLSGLNAEIKYQHQRINSKNEEKAEENSYEARNLINRFAQIDVLGNITYPVPLGGYLQTALNEVRSNQLRLQINYDKYFKGKSLSIITGYEIRSKQTHIDNSRRYGYIDEISYTNSVIDFISYFSTNTSTSTSRIPTGTTRINTLIDNFLSPYLSLSYNYRKKFQFDLTTRKDKANLFGVNANMKGSPFWSLAGGIFVNELIKDSRLPFLKLRVSHGVNGNISRIASAYPIANFGNNARAHNYPVSTILYSPNSNLSWEKVKMTNVGIDFSLKENRIEGSLEYYHKNADNLLAETPVDITLGFSTAYLNSANISGNGIDSRVSFKILQKTLKWETQLIYSFNKLIVKKYLMPKPSQGYSYTTSFYAINPVEGRPLYSAYAYNWAGLSHDTGEPLFWKDGKQSRNYTEIFTSTGIDELIYFGPAQPIHFGAIRNQFNFRRVSMSFNISYQLGHYFKTSSLINSVLVNGWEGHSDYSQRWQKPGDEKITNVPALIYPTNTTRDNLYREASIHIQKADNLRLEDINISYSFKSRIVDNYRVFKVFLFVDQLPVIWLKNSKGVDPYYNNVEMPSTRYSIGFNVSL